MGDFPEVYRVYCPTRLMGGPGALARLGEELVRLGARRVLVLTDAGVQAAGLAETVALAVGARVEVVGTFAGCKPEAEAGAVMAAAKAAVEAKADALVAVGGGSVMDTAKGVNVVLTLKGHILDLVNARSQGPNALKICCVPTTAGTGSEVTPAAVFKDEQTHHKVSITGYHVQPDLAALAPELTLGLPPRLTAWTGFDALCHAIETYVSRQHNPFSDALALQAIRLIRTHLPVALRDGQNLQARYAMLVAANQAAMAFAQAWLGVAHAMAHAAGALYGVHHGLGCAIALPEAMGFNLPVAEPRLAEVAAVMGAPASPEAAIAAVAAFRTECGIPGSFAEAGVPATAAVAAQLAREAAPDPVLRTNPRPVTEADLTELFQRNLGVKAAHG